MESVDTGVSSPLLADVRQLIDAARQRVASAVNFELTQLYWHIGRRISSNLLQGQRGEYGKAVVAELARKLTAEFGKGWSAQQLRHCIRMAEVFPEEQILSTAQRELSWSHLKALIYVDDPLKRDFYIEICRLEHWSVRQLQERINSMLFERTAISKKPEETIHQDIGLLREQGKLSPDLTFRDPYVLDFLGLSDSYSEKDLETAILAELQRFIIELGSDFAFLARQKRITIDQRDYYIDLLFYHRRLRRLGACRTWGVESEKRPRRGQFLPDSQPHSPAMGQEDGEKWTAAVNLQPTLPKSDRLLVAIDLKIGEFQAAYKGQMELYLRYLEKHEQVEGEATPIGLILCAGKSEEHIELLQLPQSNIRVADYLTLLPPRETLQAKLHQSIELARIKLQTSH